MCGGTGNPPVKEILENDLNDEYDVLKAEDGEMAYEMIKQNRNTLSLILLDLMMPKLSGLELLVRLNEDPELKGIPVIVLTSDQDSEVDSLKKGAFDFIPKPYPQPDVIKARVSRSIELAEDRQIISSTERDELTGLFTVEYFYRYGNQYDKFYPLAEMDALCFDINHFHVLNERFGIAKGDEILKCITHRLEKAFLIREVLSAGKLLILSLFTVLIRKTIPVLLSRCLQLLKNLKLQLKYASAFIRSATRNWISTQGLTVPRSLQVGMNAHLSKPVEPDRLYQTLEELIWDYDQGRN
ncbi:MAG: response regulator [Saccharofermentans sp.]|nr:response regulator [Saccharofermentans sp.]